MAIESTTLAGEKFLKHQANALDYLYDMPLANDSLFLAEVNTPDVGTGCFRIKKITFTPPKIKYEPSEVLRTSLMTGLERNDEVTIEWYEDAFNTIQKWTLAFIRNRIDFASGLWKVGGAVTPLDIDVYHFAYVEANPDISSPFDSVAFPKCTDILQLKGLKPTGISELTYDSEAGSSVKTISITYKCDYAFMQNNASAKTEWNSEDFWGFAGRLQLI